jgi:hypothetical protein
MTYESDPNSAPDSEFVPGALGHLVVGNRGRLLDARRTPLTVAAIEPQIGAFEVQIDAFEDAGARWEVPLEDVAEFQFARDAARAAVDVVAELEAAMARFDRLCAIECEPAARAATLRRVAAERACAGEWLEDRLSGVAVDVAACIERREGDPTLFTLLDDYLSARDLVAIDRRFAEAFVSNPRSGELVKGHAIVLAELGLCPYRGKVVRDPSLFDGEWSKARRAEHLVVRLAFTQELWSLLGGAGVTLYRAAAVDGALPPARPKSLISATFSRAVADAHFEGGAATTVAVLWRQVVGLERLLMTFLETRAMNARFREAEAVLLVDLDNRAF